MIGTPRPRQARCEFCGKLLEHGDPVDIPFKVERRDADSNEVRLPAYYKPYAQLWCLYDEENEATPYINAAAGISDDGWVAMLIEVRYCPYCGKDLWEALNDEEGA